MTDILEIFRILESLTVKRVYDLDVDVLKLITAPVIEGKEQRQIIDIFRSNKSIEEDKNGNLASFVVLTPDGLPLAFSLCDVVNCLKGYRCIK